MKFYKSINPTINTYLFSFAIFLLISTLSFAQVLEFESFIKLPSEMGWEYNTNTSQTIFTINNNLLVQESVGMGYKYGYYQLPRHSTVSSTKPFVLKVRAKVSQIEGGVSGMFFNVIHNNSLYTVKLLENEINVTNLTAENLISISNNNTQFNDIILIGGINNQFSLYINNQLLYTGTPVPLENISYSIHYDLAFGDGSDRYNVNANGIWASYQFYQTNEYPEIVSIQDVPNDHGNWINLNFLRSIYDNGDNNSEIYTVEINDGSGWVAAKTINAIGKDTYTVKVPTTMNRTIEVDGKIQFRVIAGMEEGNYQSNIETGFSLDNLAPEKPSNLSATLTPEMNVDLHWKLNSEEDLSHYNVYILDSQNTRKHLAVVSDTTYLHQDAVPNQSSTYYVSAVDLSGNESEFTEVVIYVRDVAPIITSIEDVPEDQGYWVKVNFQKCYFDNDSLTNPNKGHVNYYKVEKDDGFGWDSAGYTVAYGKDEYSILVETERNSNVDNDSLSNFRVTSYIGEYTFISNIISGCSIDNIAPIQPMYITASVLQDSLIKLSWKKNIEADFSHYAVRKSTDGINFEKVITTIDTIFIDANITLRNNYIYTVEAYDVAGNSSGYSEKINVILTDLEIQNDLTPDQFELKQNYPNPFNPTTTISYSIPTSGYIELVIYNISGEKIVNLVNKYQSSGVYNLSFDASQLSSGIYIYRLRADNFTATRKMMLIK